MLQEFTKEIEGVNYILKHIVKLCPNIMWVLMSCRITIKKTIAPLKREDRHKLMDELAHPENFSLAKDVSSSQTRWASIGNAEYPRRLGFFACEVTRCAITPLFERMAARLLIKFKKAIKDLLGEAIKPSAQLAFAISTDPIVHGADNGAALEEDLDQTRSDFEGIYFISFSFRSKMWVLHASQYHSGDLGCLRVKIPLHPEPLFAILSRLQEYCHAPDLEAEHRQRHIVIRCLRVRWDLHSNSEASIIDDSFVCDTRRKRRQRPDHGDTFECSIK